MAIDNMWLQSDPQAMYGAMRPTSGTNRYQDYWKGQYSNVYQDYYDQLARTAARGQMPTQTWGQYLQNDFNPQRKWRQFSPSTKGTQKKSFAPTTRWNIWG